MEWLPPLHAAHEARDTLSELRFVSWAIIGLGIGGLVLAWGRILSWLRSPDAIGPVLVRWGREGPAVYFEVRNASGNKWTVEADGARHPLEASSGRFLLLRGVLPEAALPVALHSSDGVRLPL